MGTKDVAEKRRIGINIGTQIAHAQKLLLSIGLMPLGTTYAELWDILNDAEEAISRAKNIVEIQRDQT